MKFNPTKFIWSLMIVFGSIASFKAQDVTTEDHSYKPLTLKLNDSGSKYMSLHHMASVLGHCYSKQSRHTRRKWATH
jgi:hypothetical protein